MEEKLKNISLLPHDSRAHVAFFGGRRGEGDGEGDREGMCVCVCVCVSVQALLQPINWRTI